MWGCLLLYKRRTGKQHFSGDGSRSAPISHAGYDEGFWCKMCANGIIIKDFFAENKVKSRKQKMAIHFVSKRYAT